MLGFALELAHHTGELLLDYRRRGLSGQINTKISHMDLVTAGDLAAERLISEAIHVRFPEHAVYAEESARGKLPDVEWLWVVDPVDGTTNFAHGLPLFAVNIGLAHQGVPVMGVTHAPALGSTFFAEHGGGAWLRQDGSDRRMSVTATGDLGLALLGTGFPYDRAAVADNNLAETTALDMRAQGVRRLGSAALEIAWVASGALDAYWESRAQVWDWTAGAVLVREAGGTVTTYLGNAWQMGDRSILASNGQQTLHSRLREIIQEARSRPPLA